MQKITSEQSPTLEELRARLQKMTVKQLREFGLAAAYMSEKDNLGKPPRDAYVLQLEEARKEWKLRRDKKKQDRKTLRIK